MYEDLYCNLKNACYTFSPKSRYVRTCPRKILPAVELSKGTTNSSQLGWSLTGGSTVAEHSMMRRVLCFGKLPERARAGKIGLSFSATK